MGKEIQEYLIEHQYDIPRKLEPLASNYPLVSWNEAHKLYALSVNEVLVLYHAKHLYDTPLSYGRGLGAVRVIFEEKLVKLSKIRGIEYIEKGVY